ncbi:MAG: hypothetical protein PHY45_17930 [Rhodocyclaceae bacterium]|nr:hypothetical protein [Rhodocyclaceae bacterium]
MTFSVLVAAIALAGCVNVHVHFPAAPPAAGEPKAPADAKTPADTKTP